MSDVRALVGAGGGELGREKMNPYTLICTWTIPLRCSGAASLAFAFVCHPEVLPIYRTLPVSGRQKLGMGEGWAAGGVIVYVSCHSLIAVQLDWQPGVPREGLRWPGALGDATQ